MRTKTQLIGRGRVWLHPALPLDPRRFMALLRKRFGSRICIAMGADYCCASVPHRFRLSASRNRVAVTLLKGSSVGTREMDLLALQDALEDLLPLEAVRAA